jgi:hypothetical protein
MTKDPILVQLAQALRDGRSQTRSVTSAEAYAQADRSLRGLTVEPKSGACFGPLRNDARGSSSTK